MKKSFVRRYFWNKYVIIGLVVLIIVAYFVFFSGKKPAKLEYVTVAVGNVMEKVSVTGKISPVEKGDLAFQKGGVVKIINVEVGSRIRKGDIIAALDDAGDKAALASAQAKLADLSRGLNAPEMAAEKSKVAAASVALGNAKQEALNAARNGYVLAQSAVNNYADNLFTNPQSPYPTIRVRTQSGPEENTINYARVTVNDALVKWKSNLDLNVSLDMASVLLDQSNVHIGTIKSFMSSLSTIVSNLSTGNSGLSQSDINDDVLSMNTGLSNLNQAISSITGAKTALENASAAFEQANNNYLLKNSGSSAQSIAAQMATVDSYKAELSKDSIVSPIDGLVTKADPHTGEFVSPGETAFTVISDGDYKIEAYVPEADIAKITLGDMASTTLDAYGSYVDFPAIVTALDPAETVLEGVPTYKVTLKFVQIDERIRSGMTANLDILTEKRDNVIIVPTRSVLDTEGQKSVRLLDAEGQTFITVPVTVGLKGSDGMIEIMNGISIGDKVVTYVK